ncbi:hypothetical protein ILUMI_23571 [Ignelater luminosus]|uniref:Peptidase S1 domain-containing protein n=1 Tax=Ignelater luminosus TaxID=2038154 RepID=A0A8K0CDN0_IGNLU|nr:hypothetical protein ILUMI_23571 [Ignelater luminosus]
MIIFIFTVFCILNSEAMHISNVSVWEVRQFISALPVVSEGVTDSGEFSFLVIIIDERVEICNGVIVAQDKVLASYVCMKPEIYLTQKESVTKISILAGIRDTSAIADGKKPPVWRHAKEISCSSNSSDADLMLIRLNSNLKFTKRISSIQLPSEPFHGESTCLTVGFIFTATLRSIYQYKQDVQVYDSKKCRKDFPEISNSICSLTNDLDKWDCRVDDGRLALCDRTLTGFVKRTLSNNTNCTIGSPLILSDVGDYKEFLNKEVGLVQHDSDHEQKFHRILPRMSNFSKSGGRSNQTLKILINVNSILVILKLILI